MHRKVGCIFKRGDHKYSAQNNTKASFPPLDSTQRRHQ